MPDPDGMWGQNSRPAGDPLVDAPLRVSANSPSGAPSPSPKGRAARPSHVPRRPLDEDLLIPGPCGRLRGPTQPPAPDCCLMEDKPPQPPAVPTGTPVVRAEVNDGYQRGTAYGAAAVDTRLHADRTGDGSGHRRDPGGGAPAGGAE